MLISSNSREVEIWDGLEDLERGYVYDESVGYVRYKPELVELIFASKASSLPEEVIENGRRGIYNRNIEQELSDARIKAIYGSEHFYGEKGVLGLRRIDQIKVGISDY